MKLFFFGSVIGALAIIASCTHSTATNKIPGAFEYREIYLPKVDENENDVLGLNSIDDDWGIWGHNLSNILPEKPSEAIFARTGGAPDRDQFCFSSPKLFNYIKEYINDNYGRNDSIDFAILPNDNDIVCQCEACVRIGNTEEDASPAVLRLIEKLCAEYPNHNFFTSYYATTRSLPKNKLPKNAGVLVSAIEYPLTSWSTPQEQKFRALLQKWREKTDKVYVWDYVNNFDDYFTPFPIFNVMQHRLKLYKEMGVAGVFLNGSGTDYSTFSHLHKVVLSKMMIDPNINWRNELRKAAKEYYPVSGDDIADYIIAQEDYAASTGKALPMYEGVEKSLGIYLQADKTRDLYNKIKAHKKNAKGAEKEELDKLESALSLTMLELNRIEGKLDGSEALLKSLEKLPREEIEGYNEAYWSIAKYIGNYEFLLNNAKEVEGKNLLKGVTLRPFNPLDEEYNDISIITDGILGIPSNYHNGNMISSADPSLAIGVPRIPGLKQIKVWLVYNPAYKIDLPAEVRFDVGGRQAVAFPQRPLRNSGHTFVEFTIPDVPGDIRLTFVKDPEGRSFAIDEIEGFAQEEN